jgi:hypothetical protein
MPKFITRVLAWLRRNPTARADALELAAEALELRAAGVTNTTRRARMERRAALYRARAEQLRRAP